MRVDAFRMRAGSADGAEICSRGCLPYPHKIASTPQCEQHARVMRGKDRETLPLPCTCSGVHHPHDTRNPDCNNYDIETVQGVPF